VDNRNHIKTGEYLMSKIQDNTTEFENTGLLSDTGNYKVTMAVFLEAIARLFGVDDVERLKLYWTDISEFTDDSIEYSELQLQQIGYALPNGNAEKILYSYDEHCFEVRPDKPNQMFIDSIAKLILEENCTCKFHNIFIPRIHDLEVKKEATHGSLICGKSIKGHLILSQYFER